MDDSVGLIGDAPVVSDKDDRMAFGVELME
jgi:hypothetical protein